MKGTCSYRLKVVAAVVAAAFSLLHPTEARAQAAVFDAVQAGNMVLQFVENRISDAEAFEHMLTQIAEARKLYQFLDQAYSFTQRFITDSQILKETYENYEYIKGDLRSLEYQYQSYANGGKISARRLYYTACVVDRVAGDAYDEFRFLKEEVLSDKYKDLTHKDRLELFAEASRKFRRYHTLLGQVIAENNLIIKKAEASEAEAETLEDALNISGNAGKGAYTINVENLVDQIKNGNKSIDAPIRTSGKTTENDVKEGLTSQQATRSVLNLVMWAIFIIAMALIPFQLVRIQSGEHGSQNSLWKVVFGLIISLMLLQMVKWIFF